MSATAELGRTRFIPGSVNLDITTHYANSIAVDGILKTGDQTVIKHHQRKGEPHCNDDDDRPPFVAPDISPCQAKI
jgi:hypothetical protein